MKKIKSSKILYSLVLFVTSGMLCLTAVFAWILYNIHISSNTIDAAKISLSMAVAKYDNNQYNSLSLSSSGKFDVGINADTILAEDLETGYFRLEIKNTSNRKVSAAFSYSKPAAEDYESDDLTLIIHENLILYQLSDAYFADDLGNPPVCLPNANLNSGGKFGDKSQMSLFNFEKTAANANFVQEESRIQKDFEFVFSNGVKLDANQSVYYFLSIAYNPNAILDILRDYKDQYGLKLEARVNLQAIGKAVSR